MSDLASLIILFIGLAIILHFWLLRRFYLISFKIPGPIGIPFIGIAHWFYDLNKLFDVFKYLREKYGNISCLWLGPHFYVTISDPAAVQRVLNSSECINKSHSYRFFKDVLGESILIMKSPKWNYHRRLLNPSFNQKVLINFFKDFNSETNILIEKFENLVGKEDVLLIDTLERYTFDTTCKTTMGTKMNTQNGQKVNFFDGVRNAKFLIGVRIFSILFQINAIYRRTKWYKLQEWSKSAVYGQTKELINNKITEYKDNDVVESDDDNVGSAKLCSFVDHAIRLHFEKKFTFQNVLEDAVFVVAASYDSVAIGMAFTILCLAMYPKYQELVREEINSIYLDNDIDVTYEDTLKMTYTDMVIKEALRLFPPVPFLARQTSSDFKLNEEISLPQGTQLFINIFHMHRDPKIWGDDANTFNPDHFLPDAVAQRNPFAFIPFSKGPRICIGYNYSYMLIKVFLAKILKKYRFTTNQKVDDFSFVMAVTIKPSIEPIVKIHKIDES